MKTLLDLNLFEHQLKLSLNINDIRKIALDLFKETKEWRERLTCPECGGIESILEEVCWVCQKKYEEETKKQMEEFKKKC
jgi:hypothetical protein